MHQELENYVARLLSAATTSPSSVSDFKTGMVAAPNTEDIDFADLIQNELSEFSKAMLQAYPALYNLVAAHLSVNTQLIKNSGHDDEYGRYNHTVIVRYNFGDSYLNIKYSLRLESIMSKSRAILAKCGGVAEFMLLCIEDMKAEMMDDTGVTLAEAPCPALFNFSTTYWRLESTIYWRLEYVSRVVEFLEKFYEARPAARLWKQRDAESRQMPCEKIN